MTTSEAVFSECQKAFDSVAPSLDIRLKLSARRDLLARALFGVSHSRAMVRARAGKLEEISVRHDHITVSEALFGLPPGIMLDAVVRSVPPFAAVYDGASRFAQHPNAILAVVGLPGPRRESVLSIATHALMKAKPLGSHRAYRTQPMDHAFSAKSLHESLLLREPGVAFRPFVQAKLRVMARMDDDTLTCDAVDSPSLIETVAEIAHWGKRMAIAFDLMEYMAKFGALIGRSQRSSVFVFNADAPGMKMTSIPGPQEDRPRLFVDTIDHAVHIASRWAEERNSALDGLSDEDWRRALLVVHDTLGRLKNRRLGATQLEAALKREGVKDELRSALAARVFPMIP